MEKDKLFMVLLAVNFMASGTLFSMEHQQSKPVNFLKFHNRQITFKFQDELALACYKGDHELVKELLAGDYVIKFRRGATNSGPFRIQAVPEYDFSEHNLCKNVLNRTTSCDYSPLQLAVASGNTELVTFLLEKGADPNYIGPSYSGQSTPLHCACLIGTYEMVKALIKAGARTDELYRATTPAYCALAAGRYDVAALCGVDFDKGMCDKRSAKAFLRGNRSLLNPKELKVVLELYPDFINKKGPCDCTPLHHAAQRGDQEAMKVLIEYGADESAQDCQGRRAHQMLKEWNAIYEEQSGDRSKTTDEYFDRSVSSECKCPKWRGRTTYEKF